MWTPHAVRGDDGATHLTGRVGDRLIVRFAGPVSGYDGCSWVGQVKKSLDGAIIAEFTFEDQSTSTDLDLTAIIADTSVFDPGCTYLWDIRVSSGDPAVTTPLYGTLVGDRAVTDLTPGPVVTAVLPPTGDVAGGTTVYITGTHLENVENITFDGLDVPVFDVIGSTLIIVQTDAHAAGEVPVVVTTANGVSLSATYTYSE